MNESDHLYYNMFLANSEAFTNPLYKKVSFTEYRSSSIIKYPENYVCSLIRFSLSTSLIPLFIYPNTLNTNGTRTVDNTQYLVSITHSNTVFTAPIIYVSKNLDFTPNDEEYYYVESFQDFLDQINAAYIVAFNAMKVAFPAAPPTESPYLTYDPATKLFSLFAQQSYTTAPTTTVGMNICTYNLFQSFDVQYNSVAATSSNYVSILIKNNKNNTPASPAAYYQMTQEFSTLASWSILQAIVIVSNSLPIISELVPNITNNDTINLLTSNSMKIMTDFEPDFDIGFQSSFIQYHPTAEYKLINMSSMTDITNISIDVYWRDDRQTLRPVYISPFSGFCSIKLLFRRRS